MTAHGVKTLVDEQKTAGSPKPSPCGDATFLVEVEVSCSKAPETAKCAYTRSCPTILWQTVHLKNIEQHEPSCKALPGK